MKYIPQTRKAAQYLAKVDPKLGALIKKVGVMKVALDPDETVFESLGTSILHQQLHGKAAATILSRMKALFKNPEEFPQAQEILKATEEKLMSAGLSRAKAKAMKDLALKVSSRELPEREAAHLMTEAELIEKCCQVKGIGRWTSEMFLIFTLGRIDVLPIHDFGVRKGFMKVYNKRRMPTPKELEKYGQRWKPFRSVAAWYMWRALELPQ